MALSFTAGDAAEVVKTGDGEEKKEEGEGGAVVGEEGKTGEGGESKPKTTTE